MRGFVVLLLLCPTFLVAQSVPASIRQRLLIAQDSRDAKAVAAFLSHQNPAVRSLAAVACGSVQDTVHISLLSDMLDDRNYNVRAGAAFALGQLTSVIDARQRSRLSSALLQRLAAERNAAVRMRMLEALGKAGDEPSLNAMVEIAEGFSPDALRCEAALSVGRYAYRNITRTKATEFAVTVLRSVRTGDEWKAAYALMRINEPVLLGSHIEQIVTSTSHASPYVRMFLATALGKMSSSGRVANALLSLMASEPDWRVRVNAIRSITKVDSTLHPRVLPLLLKLFADSNEHVALTAIASVGDMSLRRSRFRTEVRKGLVEVMGGPFDRRKREAAIALGKVLGADAYPILAERFRTGVVPKTAFIPALAHTPTIDAHLSLIRHFKEEEEGALKRQALESLLHAARIAHEDSAMVKLARPVFVEALEARDVTVVATAASALADTMFADERSVLPLTAALHRLKGPANADAIVAIIQALRDLKSMASVAPLESVLNDSDRTVNAEAVKALEQITGKSYTAFLRADSLPAYVNHDWKLLARVEANPTVAVQTSRGSFTMQMLPAEAPFTCMNFASLINRQFFDGLPFHRVVPNFVIQGGDPRGDGWGGPGYAMRSEFGLAHYGEGMVGVASSGKDTEGSQWFVTHCPTPHLDGRYTIFAKVVSGMDAVAAIQVGDTITSMRFAK